MDNCIVLDSGTIFRYDDLENNKYWIEDIAKSLSNLCRFNGHIHYFNSVAEHSVYVSRLVGDNPKKQIAALLHDAAEAYIGDIVTPLKNMFPELKELENKILLKIYSKFGVEDFFDNKDIKTADYIQLCREFPSPEVIEDELKLSLVSGGFPPIGLSSEQAYNWFLDNFYYYNSRI